MYQQSHSYLRFTEQTLVKPPKDHRKDPPGDRRHSGSVKTSYRSPKIWGLSWSKISIWEKKSTSRGKKKKWLDSCATPRKAPHSFGSLSCHSHWFGHQDTNDSREGPALLGRSEPVEIEYGELPGRIHKNWVPKQIRKLGYVYTIPFYTSIFQIHLKWKVILNSHQLQTIFSFGASWSC